MFGMSANRQPFLPAQAMQRHGVNDAVDFRSEAPGPSDL